MSDPKVAAAITGLELWGVGTARTLRPLWAAEELGLELLVHPIGPRTGETQTESYGEINPKRKVPALVHGSLRLSESLAICRYLRELADSDALWRPMSRVERAREDEWCCFALAELDETSLYVMRRHRDLSAIYGEAPQAVEASARYAERLFGVVGEHLSRNAWLAGDGFGLADLMMTTCVDWAIAYEVAVPANVRAWRDGIARRPAYGAATARNRPPRRD